MAGNTRSLIANRGDLIQAMQNAGHEVQAVVPAYDLLSAIEDLGIEWRTVDLDRAGANPWADLCAVGQLFTVIRELDPDKVFAYTIKPIVYGVHVARWAGVDEVYAMITGLGHLFTGDSLKRALLRFIACRLYRSALARADGVFFQNPDDLSLFRSSDLLPDTVPGVLVNGSGVNTDRFAAAPLPDGPLTFLAIARLLDDKGLAEFVEAASRLKPRHPEVRFQILGPHDPALPHALPLNVVKKWRADPVVELLGHQTDVRPFIRRAHVYVLASYREGTPRSVLEAMSMGRPIITSDAPGCRETVVQGDNGLLVPPRTVTPLADAMERFIENPSLVQTMGKRSRQLAETKYDVRKVNAVILETMGVAPPGLEDGCESPVLGREGTNAQPRS